MAEGGDLMYRRIPYFNGALFADVAVEPLSSTALTNLYNALTMCRGTEKIKVPAAADFAPCLDALHQALDRAVCDVYGWDHVILADEEAILRHLLELNQSRAG